MHKSKTAKLKFISLKAHIMEQNKKAHKIVSEKEWLAARIELLQAEKALTRQSDEVARQRQQLPWVRVDKEYTFDTETGKVSLADLFCGRSQLLVYHFMYGPEYKAGCPSCSSIADSFNGIAVHLANHDVMFTAISRAPLEKLQEYKRRMGWSFPWASSFGNDFNYDFHVSFTADQQQTGDIEYNYRSGNVSSRANEIKPAEAVSEGGKKFAESVGTDWAAYTREAPGMSAFVLEDGVVYHTYSAYERGLDGLWSMYQWLDRAPLGRNEAGNTLWFRRHDEYGNGTQKSCCS
jgi:predicted dithiol-disulfide oxidoreductase (DUF899 family)